MGGQGKYCRKISNTLLTSKGWPHGEIMVIYSQKLFRFSSPRFGHVMVLLIYGTSMETKALSGPKNIIPET